MVKSIRYEWDSQKNFANQLKHSLSFDDILSVFDDQNALSTNDEKHSGIQEDRWLTLGRTVLGIVCIVVHTERIDKNIQIIRIISARRATKREEMQYYV